MGTTINPTQHREITIQDNNKYTSSITEEELNDYIKILTTLPHFENIENIDQLFRYILEEFYINIPSEVEVFFKGLSYDKMKYMDSFYDGVFKEKGIDIEDYDISADIKRKLVFQINRLLQYKGSNQVFDTLAFLLKEYINEIKFYNIEVVQVGKILQTERFPVDTDSNTFIDINKNVKNIREGVLEETQLDNPYFIDNEGYVYDVFYEDEEVDDQIVSKMYVQLNEGTHKLEYRLRPLITTPIEDFNETKHDFMAYRSVSLNEINSIKFISQLKQFTNRDRDTLFKELNIYPVLTNIIHAEVQQLSKIDFMKNHSDLIRLYGFTSLQSRTFNITLYDHQFEVPFLDLMLIINYIRQKAVNYTEYYNLQFPLNSYIRDESEIPQILEFMERYENLDYSIRNDTQEFIQDLNLFKHNPNKPFNFNHINTMNNYLRGQLRYINSIDELKILINNQFETIYNSEQKEKFLEDIDNLIIIKNITDVNQLIKELNTYYPEEMNVVLNLTDTLEKYPRAMALIDVNMNKTQEENYITSIQILRIIYNNILLEIEDGINKKFIDDLFTRLFLGADYLNTFAKPILKLFNEYFFKIETTFKQFSNDPILIKDKLNSIAFDDKFIISPAANLKDQIDLLDWWCLTINDTSFGDCVDNDEVYNNPCIYPPEKIMDIKFKYYADIVEGQSQSYIMEVRDAITLEQWGYDSDSIESKLTIEVILEPWGINEIETEDVGATSYVLVLEPGSWQSSFTISAVDDGFFDALGNEEGQEYFRINVKSVTEEITLTTGYPSWAESLPQLATYELPDEYVLVTPLDSSIIQGDLDQAPDLKPKVYFESTSVDPESGEDPGVEILEGTSAVFTAYLVNASDDEPYGTGDDYTTRDVTVDVKLFPYVMNSLDGIEDEDVEQLTYTLNFPNGVREVEFTISAVDDGFFNDDYSEENQEFFLINWTALEETITLIGDINDVPYNPSSLNLGTLDYTPESNPSNYVTCNTLTSSIVQGEIPKIPASFFIENIPNNNGGEDGYLYEGDSVDLNIRIVDDSASTLTNKVYYDLLPDEYLDVQMELSFGGPQVASVSANALYVSGSNARYQYGYFDITQGLSEPDSWPALEFLKYNEFQSINLGAVKEVNVKSSDSILALQLDGTLLGIGNNDYGQLGKSTTHEIELSGYKAKFKLDKLTNLTIETIVGCNNTCSVVLGQDNKYYAAGDISKIGLGSMNDDVSMNADDFKNGFELLTYQNSMADIQQLFIGEESSYIIDTNNHLKSAGHNKFSQLGNGQSNITQDTYDSLVYDDLDSNSDPEPNISKFKTSKNACVAQTDTGVIYVWGAEKGINPNIQSSSPAYMFGIDPDIVDYDSFIITKATNLFSKIGANYVIEIDPHRSPLEGIVDVDDDGKKYIFQNIIDFFILGSGLYLMIADPNNSDYSRLFRITKPENEEITIIQEVPIFDLISNSAKTDFCSESFGYIDPLTTKLYMYGDNNAYGNLGLNHYENWYYSKTLDRIRTLNWTSVENVSTLNLGLKNSAIILESVTSERRSQLLAEGSNDTKEATPVSSEAGASDLSSYTPVLPTRIDKFYASKTYGVNGTSSTPATAIRKNGDVYIWGPAWNNEVTFESQRKLIASGIKLSDCKNQNMVFIDKNDDMFILGKNSQLTAYSVFPGIIPDLSDTGSSINTIQKVDPKYLPHMTVDAEGIITSVDPIIDISISSTNIFYITESGKLYGIGKGTLLYDNGNQNDFVEIELVYENNNGDTNDMGIPKRVYAGNVNIFVQTNTGLYGYGSNAYGCMGDDNLGTAYNAENVNTQFYKLSQLDIDPTTITKISNNYYSTYILTKTLNSDGNYKGTLYVAGRNQKGALGIPYNSNEFSPLTKISETDYNDIVDFDVLCDTSTTKDTLVIFYKDNPINVYGKRAVAGYNNTNLNSLVVLGDEYYNGLFKIDNPTKINGSEIRPLNAYCSTHSHYYLSDELPNITINYNIIGFSDISISETYYKGNITNCFGYDPGHPQSSLMLIKQSFSKDETHYYFCTKVGANYTFNLKAIEDAIPEIFTDANGNPTYEKVLLRVIGILDNDGILDVRKGDPNDPPSEQVIKQINQWTFDEPERYTILLKDKQ